MRCGESEASSQSAVQMTREMQQMVKDLRDGVQPKDDGTETTLDAELNKMSYPDFEGLCKACAKLTVKSKDKMLDVVFQGHITAMVGAINLYMSSELLYTW